MLKAFSREMKYWVTLCVQVSHRLSCTTGSTVQPYGRSALILHPFRCMAQERTGCDALRCETSGSGRAGSAARIFAKFARAAFPRKTLCTFFAASSSSSSGELIFTGCGLAATVSGTSPAKRLTSTRLKTCNMRRKNSTRANVYTRNSPAS